MRISTQAASVSALAAMLIFPAAALAQDGDTLEGTGPGNPNYEISGEAGYDPTLPSLEGDTYIDPGVPLEGDVWYFGHGGKYGGDFGPAKNVGPGEAKDMARAACGEFDENFADDRDESRGCVAANAFAAQSGATTPWKACRYIGLSRIAEVSERRPDFGACVVAGRSIRAQLS